MKDCEDYCWPDKLNLFNFFDGKSMAYGLFQDRFGNVRRRFYVVIEGVVLDDELTLSEYFVYDDGEVDNRTWTIHHNRSDLYAGRADDVVGIAKGAGYDDSFNWRYDMRLAIQGRKVKVSFDDWTYAMPNNVLLNQAVVRKWGIKVGTVFISFVKQ